MSSAKWAVAIALVVDACTVGPDFTRPEAPSTTTYTHDAVTMPAAGTSDPMQVLRPGASVEARWWDAFHAVALDDVVRMAIDGSPTLAAARAKVAEAQEAVVAARGAFYPQVDLASAAARGGAGRNAVRAGGSSSQFTFNPTILYDADAFGATRRLVEQQGALADVRRYELAAAYLSLTGGAVSQAIAIASASEQIAAVGDIVAIDERNVALVEIAFESGKVARTDLLDAQSQLASDRALLPPLLQQTSVAQHALAVLAGKLPAQWAPPAFTLDGLGLPTDLPLAAPSSLVHARPDILAAEAQLHAASAAVGVATARLYPQITLSASWVQQAATLGTLFDAPNGIWTVAAQLAAPLFHGGTLEAQRRGTIDALAAQLATYRQTVLVAFAQVADDLRALEHDAQALAAQRAALDAAQAALALDQQSYVAGQATFLQVLQSQRLYQEARLGYARARGQRYQDTVQFFLALGGGWQQAPEASP